MVTLQPPSLLQSVAPFDSTLDVFAEIDALKHGHQPYTAPAAIALFAILLVGCISVGRAARLITRCDTPAATTSKRPGYVFASTDCECRGVLPSMNIQIITK